VLNKNYNEKCDIWSLGVIFYMMLAGTPPFNAKSDSEIYEKILEGKYQLPERKFKNVSEDAKNLLGRMLEYDPVKRISARQALKHPWIACRRNSETNLYIDN
jgi:calcium-dependent protein kinase